MTTTQPRNFSVLTKDLARNPGLLERLKGQAYRLPGHGAVTVTTHGDVTTVTAA